MGVAMVSLLAKLHTWDETAMFFDGSSIGMLHLWGAYM